ncbi:MAG: S9 family peptidase [Rubrivivax sp.]|nr:S9 family peptidase [Rubrivivax sp.]
MCSLHRLSLPLAALAASFVFAGCTSLQPSPPSPPLPPPPAMRTEGVPVVTRAPMEAAQLYGRVAGHVFVDWHPQRPEMLVNHRAQGASTTQLFRVRAPLAAPEPLTEGADPVTGARWEPRHGRYLVFARGRGGDEAYQLFRLDPTTRSATQFTQDGQRHALLGWLAAGGQALVASVPLDRTAEGGRRREVSTTLTLMDPEAPQGARVLAELPGGGWSAAEASPDDRKIALTRYISVTESEVWLLDVASGQRQRLLPAPGETLRAAHLASAWTPDGRALYFESDRAGEFRELMRIDVAGGSITRLTTHTPWDVSWAGATRDGSTLAVIANVDGRDELRLLDAATGALKPQPRLPGGSITRARFHRASDALAVVVSGAQGPAQVHVLAADAAQTTAWTQPTGTEGLDLAGLPEQQVVRWKSFDGRTISGLLTLPPERFGGRRPVVMMVHGGPEGQSKLGWQGRLNYLVQELGIAVLHPNVRGSTGYGKTFVSLDNGRLREDSVKDMGTAIDWIATQPRLDAARVVVIGGSYGGYMALAASTLLADRIAGALSAVGISNFISFLENTESYRRDLRRVEYGDERDPAMRAFLHEISPLNRAHRITKPLMVVQGRNDPRVPWTESEQIVRSLQQRGTPVWYLLADNEGHGFARRENSDYMFAVQLEFLQRTLKP